MNNHRIPSTCCLACFSFVRFCCQPDVLLPFTPPAVLDQVKADVLGKPYTKQHYPLPKQLKHDPLEGVTVHDFEDAPKIVVGDPIEQMQSIDIRFHLYSEGTEADFLNYITWAKKNGVAMRVHLNGDFRDAFHAMVEAPVLVHGPSAFGILAAKYNMGRQFAMDRYRPGGSKCDGVCDGEVTVVPARSL